MRRLSWLLFSLCSFMQVCLSPGAAVPLPEYIWPLGNTTVYAEVMKGHDAVLPGDDQCFLFDEAYPSMPYDALRLTGQSDSYVDIKLDGQVQFQDLALSFYVYPDGEPVGTLVHYLYETGNILKISMMEQYLFISFWDEYGVSVGSSALAELLKANTWSHIVITRDFETGRIQVFHNQEMVENLDDDFPNEIQLPVKGALRLGRSHDTDSSNDGFRGRITCFQMYSSLPSSNNVKKLAGYCLPNTWKVKPEVHLEAREIGGVEKYCLTEESRQGPVQEVEIKAQVCDTLGLHCLTGSDAWNAVMRKNKWSDSGRDTAYFHVVSRDYIPNMDDHLLGVVSTTGHRVCSRLCMRVQGCESFASETQSHFNTKCLLFDSIREASKQEAGARYYAIRT